MGLFDISISGLLSNKAAISTASHNIANANVEGYSRQRVSQNSRTPEFIGGNYFGVGVEISSVKRVFEAAQQLELQANTADFFQADSFFQQAARVDTLLADSKNGISKTIQNYFTALQGVVNDPASIPARQVMLSESQTMMARFEQVHKQLETQMTEINGNIDSIAQEITARAQAIAKLNNEIVSSPGSLPPDLLDKRDVEVARLSELVSVQTLTQSDGGINVFIGTGQSLVVGALANQLKAEVDPANPKGMRLSITAGSSPIDVTRNLNGGKLGGLLSVVSDVIDPSFNTLGRVAMAISQKTNTQHRLGIDLNNQLGGNFFTDINDASLTASRAIKSTANTGTANLAVSINDPALLNDSNYRLFFNAGNYQLINKTTDAVVTTFAAPAVPGNVSVTAEGFTINFLSGAPANGDVFEIQATRNFARDINTLISTPEKIAAALPIRGEQASSNTGSASIKALTVSNTGTAQFTTTPGNITPPIRIQFGPAANQFSIINATTSAPIGGPFGGFVANQSNNMLALAGAPYNAYGYEITIEGQPQVGDRFEVTYNNNGSGDNGNVRLLADLQSAASLDNGKSNFQQGFGRIISQVGVKTQSAEITRTSSESLLFQAKERKQSTSGVNLDEEAANLIKFQQAYEASAQVISVARTLFQTVLDSVR